MGRVGGLIKQTALLPSGKQQTKTARAAALNRRTRPDFSLPWGNSPTAGRAAFLPHRCSARSSCALLILERPATLRRVASLYSSARVLPLAVERCFPPLDARFAADVRLVPEDRAVLAARLVAAVRLAPVVRFGPAVRLAPEDARLAVEVFFVLDERVLPDDRAAAVADRLVLVVRFALVRVALEARLVPDPLFALDAFAVRRPRPGRCRRAVPSP